MDNIKVMFAAIEPYLERQIISPKETNLTGRNRVEWGERNLYPEYLWELYKEVPTLQTIVNGSADFVCGDDIEVSFPLNRENMALELVKALALDSFLYGGRAYQVIRDKGGKPKEVYPCPVRYLRCDKDNEVFYYCEKWGKTKSVILYPKFIPFTPEEWGKLSQEERQRHSSSILYVKNNRMQTYPLPPVASAVKDCEIQRGIDDYHLNALENAFTPSVLINFNQGKPTDEVKEQIERDINEKFSGHQNGGRILLSFNDTKDTATTITPVKIENFGERYDALAKHSRQQIFTAFRAVPAIFGLMTETTGFSEQEFSEAFRLYNRTAIRPVQRGIADELKRVFGQDVITFQPFAIDGEEKTIE